MKGFEVCLHRMALLDRADSILNDVRVYSHRVPVREAMAQHRAMLIEARRHLESAKTLYHTA